MTLICEHCFNFVPLHTQFASTERLRFRQRLDADIHTKEDIWK